MNHTPARTTEKKVLKVFVASPGDVAKERVALEKVVNEVNLTLSILTPEVGLRLELVRWETHVAPGLGSDAQDVVNQYLPRYDLFIGIMWSRFGTRTQHADSGTMEEFDRAYQRWKENHNLPVLFYFCRKLIEIPRSVEDLEQLGMVVRFHGDLSSKGLVWEYDDPTAFGDIVRQHLLLVLQRHFLTRPGQAPTVPEMGAAELDAVRRSLHALAGEYEQLRERLPVGSERTQRMIGVFSRMRAYCASAQPIVEAFMQGTTGGERLCAVAILQGAPQRPHVCWLAERAKQENWFVGYQAATALYQAIRELPADAHPMLSGAIQLALDFARGRDPSDPKQIAILENAALELREKAAPAPAPGGVE